MINNSFENYCRISSFFKQYSAFVYGIKFRLGVRYDFNYKKSDLHYIKGAQPGNVSKY